MDGIQLRYGDGPAVDAVADDVARASGGELMHVPHEYQPGGVGQGRSSVGLGNSHFTALLEALFIDLFKEANIQAVAQQLCFHGSLWTVSQNGL